MNLPTPNNPRIKNEVGNRYKRLTVVAFAGTVDNRAMWKCVCDCGNETIVSGRSLRRNNTKSCGCLVYSELLGKVFGRLTVVKRTDQKVRGNYVWECLCECGNIKLVEGAKLTVGDVQSCGCLRRDTHWKGWNDISLTYFHGLINRAKYKDIAFNITIEEVWDLFTQQEGACTISGVNLSFSNPKSASLDRIDSSCGYQAGNIQWVHKTINKMKMELPQDTFINMCSKVHMYQNGDINT